MTERLQLVLFRVEAQDFALPLRTVERVFRAVEVTRLPGAPDVVSGAIDVQGRVVPVLNLRRRFGFRERDISAADYLLLAATPVRKLALLIDEPGDVIEQDPASVLPVERIASGLQRFKGIVQTEAGLVLIQDLEKFFSFDEAHALDSALRTRP